MVIPSIAIFATAILQIILGGILGLGAGPIPSFGMIGVAYGFIIATGAGVLYFFWYLKRDEVGSASVQRRRISMGNVLRHPESRCPGLPLPSSIRIRNFDFHRSDRQARGTAPCRVWDRPAIRVLTDPHFFRYWCGIRPNGRHGDWCWKYRQSQKSHLDCGISFCL